MILSIKMVNEQLFDVIFGKKMIFEITMNIIYLLDVNNPHNDNFSIASFLMTNIDDALSVSNWDDTPTFTIEHHGEKIDFSKFSFFSSNFDHMIPAIMRAYA